MIKIKEESLNSDNTALWLKVLALMGPVYQYDFRRGVWFLRTSNFLCEKWR